MVMNFIAILVSYLIGSLSFAIIISKYFKLTDPRQYGSKNAGATNVMRSGNKKAAVLTLLGDFLKGLLVVIGAKLYFMGNINYEINIALCAIMVVLGHIYPVFFAFKGGKGVATALGVIFGISWVLALIVVAVWLIVFKISKISSLSAIMAVILAPIFAYLLLGNGIYFGVILIISFFILYTHKANIYRLISNQEHSFKSDK
jgi:glycerol-3-phosphate acyltransferase PlsY